MERRTLVVFRKQREEDNQCIASWLIGLLHMTYEPEETRTWGDKDVWSYGLMGELSNQAPCFHFILFFFFFKFL